MKRYLGSLPWTLILLGAAPALLAPTAVSAARRPTTPPPSRGLLPSLIGPPPASVTEFLAAPGEFELLLPPVPPPPVTTPPVETPPSEPPVVFVPPSLPSRPTSSRPPRTMATAMGTSQIPSSTPGNAAGMGQSSTPDLGSSIDDSTLILLNSGTLDQRRLTPPPHQSRPAPFSREAALQTLASSSLPAPYFTEPGGTGENPPLILPDLGTTDPGGAIGGGAPLVVVPSAGGPSRTATGVLLQVDAAGWVTILDMRGNSIRLKQDAGALISVNGLIVGLSDLPVGGRATVIYHGGGGSSPGFFTVLRVLGP